MIANYYAVTPQRLKEIINLVDEAESEQEIIEQLEAIGEEDTTTVLDIDQLWDGLHFLLTGVTSNNPIVDNPLSEAVVGISVADTDDFIALIEHKEIEKISKALQSVDISKLINEMDVKSFEKAKIYPNIWKEEEKAMLQEEMLNTFNNLKDFYSQVLDKQQSVLVTIY